MSPLLVVVLVLAALCEALAVGLLYVITHTTTPALATQRFPDVEVGWGRVERIRQLEQENGRLRLQLATQLHLDGVAR